MNADKEREEFDRILKALLQHPLAREVEVARLEDGSTVWKYKRSQDPLMIVAAVGFTDQKTILELNLETWYCFNYQKPEIRFIMEHLKKELDSMAEFLESDEEEYVLFMTKRLIKK